MKFPLYPVLGGRSRLELVVASSGAALRRELGLRGVVGGLGALVVSGRPARLVTGTAGGNSAACGRETPLITSFPP